MIRRPDDDKAFLPKMIAWEKKYGAGDDAAKGFHEGWDRPDFDASPWKAVTIPTDFLLPDCPAAESFGFARNSTFRRQRRASRSSSIPAIPSIWCRHSGTACG